MTGGKVSFVVPAYNSERTIGKCIESVLSQDVGKEVIVVDDGSSDGTPGIIRGFGRKVEFIGQKNAGPASARNAGLRKANGKFVAFVDADVSLPRDWAKNAISLMQKRKASAVGGPGVSPEKNAVAQSLNLLLYGKSGQKDAYVNSLATMDVMYRRDALAGMEFDTSFTSSSGEDPDLNFRLVKKGHRLLYSPGLWVHHDHPTTLGGIMRKWYKYGKHYPLLYAKHRELRGKEYYARISYVPLFIVLVALWPMSIAFPALALLQVAALFVSYLSLGAQAGAGKDLFTFAFIHTAKQLAQLLGTFVGLRKLL